MIVGFCCVMRSIVVDHGCVLDVLIDSAMEISSSLDLLLLLVVIKVVR